MIKSMYIARPVSSTSHRELAGTQGVLVGAYANTDNAVKFMIQTRGAYGVHYRLYHSSGGPNWSYIGTFSARKVV